MIPDINNAPRKRQLFGAHIMDLNSPEIDELEELNRELDGFDYDDSNDQGNEQNMMMLRSNLDQVTNAN